MNIRNRITDFRMVKASELRPNPRNWRKHPEAQQNALRGILAEVGYVDALLARTLPDGSLELVDGHLRAETTPDQEVPVLVLDVTEAEADKILATFDPLGDMAEANAEALAELLGDVETNNAAVQAMLDELAEEGGAFEADEADPPKLADGDREPFQQMTFTIHDSQAEAVKAALEAAKKAGPFIDTLNENSNGNALARIAEAYCGQG